MKTRLSDRCHLDLVNLLVQVLDCRVNLFVYAVVDCVVERDLIGYGVNGLHGDVERVQGIGGRPRKHLCPIPRALPRPEPLLHPFRPGRWGGRERWL